MKTISLFKIKGKSGYFSKTAIENNLGFLREVESWREAERSGDYYWVSHVSAQSKPYKVFDNLEKTEFHLIYSYGERYYFDTEEERETYKANLHLQAVKHQIKTLREQIKADIAKFYALQEELKNLEKK